MNQRTFLLGLAILTLASLTAFAAVSPNLMSYQGFLKDSGGDPVNGNVAVTFRIFDDPAAGTMLWEEVHSTVSVVDGNFGVILGSVAKAAVGDSVFSASNRWLEIEVDGESMSPRTQVVSTPYSLRVSTVDGASAGKVTGTMEVVPDAAKLADGALIIRGPQSDSIVFNPSADVVLGATTDNGDEAILMTSGPDGGSMQVTASDAAKALSRSVQIAPADGVALKVTEQNGDETVSLSSQPTGGVLELNASDAAKALSRTLTMAPGLGQALRVTEQNGDDVLLLSADANGGSIELNASDALKADPNAVTSKITLSPVGNSILKAEDDGGNTLVELKTEAGAGKIVLSTASSKAIQKQVEITEDGIVFWNSTLTDTNMILSAEGSIIGKGQLAMGSAVANAGSWSNVLGINNDASGDSSTISGGFNNVASGYASAVGGGVGDTAAAQYSVVSGGHYNTITSSAPWGAIGGGLRNRVTESHGVVFGGRYNEASGDASVIGGGTFNDAVGAHSVVSGGESNDAAGDHSTVGGGVSGLAIGGYSTVGGGSYNQADGLRSTVSGGGHNDAGGDYSVVAGGGGPTPLSGNTASGDYSIVAGGEKNEATAPYSAVFGTSENSATSSGAFCLGRNNNASAPGGFALGKWARARHSGSWVINAGSSSLPSDSVSSAGSNQFVVRAAGGIYITSSPGTAAYNPTKLINTSTTAYLSFGGSWVDASDRNIKENVSEVDGAALLDKLRELPVTEWNYITEGDGVKRIGPMGQDFYKIFGYGADEKSLSARDLASIAVVAIQQLDAQTRELDARTQEMEEMKAQLAELQAAMAKLLSEQQ